VNETEIQLKRLVDPEGKCPATRGNLDVDLEGELIGESVDDLWDTTEVEDENFEVSEKKRRRGLAPPSCLIRGMYKYVWKR